jgi:pantoate--beta-alanine ligase
MDVISGIAELRLALAARRRIGERIGFVPTMGALHAGHLSLADAARARTDTVVMSIFVNPLQFGPSEDFAAYPRDLPGDLAKVNARGVDLVFTPTVDVLYPHAVGWPVRVTPRIETARWEAAVRPGHFDGVLTVVAKLFNIVQPDVAFFGQKDIQQVTLIRSMVRELDIPVELVIAPTVRETDGLAMSSRNAYLDAANRRDALALSRALGTVERAWRGGIDDSAELEGRGRAVLAGTPAVQVDYFAVVEPDRLEPVGRAEAGSVVIVAARVGPTRLIDNIVLGGQSD